VTVLEQDERERAIAAADGTCPRCGTPRDPDQRYCLECGLALPAVSGRVPALRRRWIRRIGWYPGDWVWVSLLTLVVAVAGAAAAIVLTREQAAKGPTFSTVPPVVSVAEPTTPAVTPTGTLPAPPEQTTTTTPAKTHSKPKPAAPKNGRLTWPANQNGWTIVLVSYPKTTGRTAALQTAAEAAKSGLPQVGVLDSSRYASLQPGYWVVFTGIYGSQTDADAAVSTARQAGFGGAYSRQVAT
jgi:cell division septation protein DedD